MHAKQELKEMQQLDKNEEYEYSHEKAERVSLPHKNARIQPSLLQKIKENKNKQTLQVKYIRCEIGRAHV